MGGCISATCEKATPGFLFPVLFEEGSDVYTLAWLHSLVTGMQARFLLGRGAHSPSDLCLMETALAHLTASICTMSLQALGAKEAGI